MSQFSDYPPNPYQSPNPAPIMASPAKPPLPMFSMVIFIIDFFFLAFRALAVAGGIYGMSISTDSIVQDTGIFEVGAGIVMVVFGVIANTLMLMRRRWGIYLAGIKILGTLGSLAVGVWQFTYFADRFSEGPQFVGMIIGLVVGVGIRLALMILYVVAVVMFNNSFNRAASQPVQPVKQW